ncbi:MAG TPA: sulfotransferase [Tepidisphaeraceae bacterium]
MVNNIDTHLPQWLGLIQAAANYQKLFITGCPKSGTTWLANSLNGHPEIVAAGEGRFAWRLFPLVQQLGGLFNTDQKNNGGSEQGMITDAELHLVMRSFSENVFARYLMASGKPPSAVRILADKTPQHILSVPLLRALYPSCKFINIVRDPRDAATSALFHLAQNDPRSKEQYVQSFITESWKLHVEAAVAAERVLGKEVILNVRYEDMHHDEPEIIRSCLKHLGVDFTDASIQSCRQAGSFEKQSGGRQRGQTDAKSFYRSGTIGDWRNHLDPDLAHQCCNPVKGLMDRFGYAIDAAPASGLSAAA